MPTAPLELSLFPPAPPFPAIPGHVRVPLLQVYVQAQACCSHYVKLTPCQEPSSSPTKWASSADFPILVSADNSLPDMKPWSHLWVLPPSSRSPLPGPRHGTAWGPGLSHFPTARSATRHSAFVPHSPARGPSLLWQQTLPTKTPSPPGSEASGSLWGRPASQEKPRVLGGHSDVNPKSGSWILSP